MHKHLLFKIVINLSSWTRERFSLTLLLHESVCETWDLWTGQTSCCIHQMDRHMDDHRCESWHEFEDWSPKKTFSRIPQMCTEMTRHKVNDRKKRVALSLRVRTGAAEHWPGTASLQYALTDVASVWSSPQRLSHIQHRRGLVDHECAGVSSWPSCRETFYCSPTQTEVYSSWNTWQTLK